MIKRPTFILVPALSLGLTLSTSAVAIASPVTAPPVVTASLPLADTLAPQSPESFVSQIFHTIVDSSFTRYYLVAVADTCRFMKYDYDEWINYHLRESVPVVTLNELSEKVYLSRSFPYRWQQARLKKASCITPRKADSIFTIFNPALKDSAASARKILRDWQHLPLEQRTVFSFSLPQFTDDGQYAVIDLNMICGSGCGAGYTFIFRKITAGWKQIGSYRNWGGEN